MDKLQSGRMVSLLSSFLPHVPAVRLQLALGCRHVRAYLPNWLSLLRTLAAVLNLGSPLSLSALPCKPSRESQAPGEGAGLSFH